MANPLDQEVVTKFLDLVKDYKSKADGLMNEIITLYTQNLEHATKNYLELQNTYVHGYSGIAGQAQKANGQLLESMDKNYGDLKTQINNMHSELRTNANTAIDKSNTEFQAQCEEWTKKIPSLPDKAYKDVLKSIGDGKTKINNELDKRYKDVSDKIDKNFQATKKELTLPELKPPKLPSLDLSASLAANAGQVLTAAMNSIQPALKTLTDNLPSKKK